MDIRAKKELIKIELDQIEDIDIIEAVKNILALGKAKQYEQSLKPMSKEAFFRRNELSRKAIEDNNLISQEEVRAYFKRKHARR